MRVGGETGAHAGYCRGVVFVVFEQVFVVRFEAGGYSLVAAEIFDRGFEEVGYFLHVLLVGGSSTLFPLAPLLGADAEGFRAALAAAPFGEIFHPAISDVAGDCFTEGLRDSVHGGFPCRQKKRDGIVSVAGQQVPRQGTSEQHDIRERRLKTERGFERSCYSGPWLHVTVWVSLA